MSNFDSGPAIVLAFSPDGKTLASGGSTLRLWDVAAGRELTRLRRHIESVLAVAFSPDGRTLAIGGADKALKLWYAATNEDIAAQLGRVQ